MVFVVSMVLVSHSDGQTVQAGKYDSFTSVYHGEDMVGLQVDSIRHQDSERRWVEFSDLRMTTYQDEAAVPLYTPGLIGGDSHGNLFVFDYGDFRLKRYHFDQGFQTTYGLGEGEGPGEFKSAMGIETLGDSMVAVLDLYGKKVVHFSYDGKLASTTRLDRWYSRFSMEEGGAEYYMGMFPDFLIRSVSQGQEVEFPALDPQTARTRIQFAGFIQAFEDGVVYSPFTSNFFMVFATDGSLLYSSETVPHGKKTGSIGGDNSRSLSIDGDRIYIHAINTDASDSLNTVVDAYELRTGRYEWSMRLPLRSALLNISEPYFYSLQDTSVVIGTYQIRDE